MSDSDPPQKCQGMRASQFAAEGSQYPVDERNSDGRREHDQDKQRPGRDFEAGTEVTIERQGLEDSHAALDRDRRAQENGT